MLSYTNSPRIVVSPRIVGSPRMVGSPRILGYGLVMVDGGHWIVGSSHRLVEVYEVRSVDHFPNV